jgi:sialate O-acetylesterase
LAVINDLGETVDIHPLRKKEVAERIGLAFDRLIYNNKVELAPEVISSEVLDGKIILTLDQPIQAGTIYEFEVAADDGDKVFKNVDATAEGNRITLTLPESFHPMSVAYAVRYAWKDNPLKANVRSLSGLPMSSFEMKINK